MLEIIREHWVAWIIPAGFALFFTITILIFDIREYEPIVQIWKWLNSLAESAFSFIAGDGSSPKRIALAFLGHVIALAIQWIVVGVLLFALIAKIS